MATTKCAPSRGPSPEGARRPSRPKPAVLLVEDDQQMRQIFMLLMKRLTVQVAHAASAEEGLLRIKRFTPAVIVTDINLPSSSGLEMIKQLKADPLTRRIPIVAWSSNSDYRQPSLSAGAVAFINKSDKAARMVECLQEILERG